MLIYALYYYLMLGIKTFHSRSNRSLRTAVYCLFWFMPKSDTFSRKTKEIVGLCTQAIPKVGIPA